ncbi:MAG: hypothetical protein KAH25_11580, partial [Bacteroidales bacterium]|nr:hypothetical protein [Bacteroidales bacterium]
STANLAIILIDARKGVITQTKRHSFLVSLLGIKHVVVAINKMDLKDYSKEVFDGIVEEYESFSAQLNIPDVHYFPISALKGDNVVDISENMPWYRGRSLLNFLETVHVSSDRNFDDMRYPVQFVNRPDINFRGFAATVASGIVKKGQEVVSIPSGQKSRIKQILTFDGELEEAFPPQSVTITLEDEIDASRGDMFAYPDNMPMVSNQVDAMLVWMDEEAMDLEMQFFIKHANNSSRAFVSDISYRVDVNTMEHSKVDHFTLNDIGKVQITTNKPLFFDAYRKNKVTGSFILINPITNNTAAVGMIIGKSQNTKGQKVNFVGKWHQLESGQDAETKYNELKIKGRTVVRLDEAKLKSEFNEIPNEEQIEKLIQMLLSEGVDVVK